MAESARMHGAKGTDGGAEGAVTTDEILRRAIVRPGRTWWLLFGVAMAALIPGVAAVWYLLVKGVGVWGLNRTVAWAYDITNFVFWIGIGHAGTLISAILLLFRQEWRNGINRVAEVMTLIAIVCAALFPIVHLGRPWLFFWLLPLPNTRGPLWINFASPLTWDVIAISTYFVVSAIFFYLGLIPDLALLRDRTDGWMRRLLGSLAWGWSGSQRDWRNQSAACLLLAAIATPLVVSVHSVVSFDFAVTLVPGWHSTIFPPYFVVGAIFSGMAMVLLLLIPMRRGLSLERYVTLGHVDAMCRIMLATSCLLAFAYLIETWTGLTSANATDRNLALARVSGQFSAGFWLMVACNVVIPQLLWVAVIRRSTPVVFSIALLATFGMWLERFLLIVRSLERDYLPSTWTDYLPTRFEVGTLVGAFGLFFALFLLFCRLLPVIPVYEAKAARASERSGEFA